MGSSAFAPTDVPWQPISWASHTCSDDKSNRRHRIDYPDGCAVNDLDHSYNVEKAIDAYMKQSPNAGHFEITIV
jgi:hypothetical protein